MGVNKVMLLGNVGKDPEVRYLDNGTAYARLSLATGDSYKDKNGEKVERTEWHNLVFWRGLAEIVEKWVKKGDKLYVEGSIRTTMSEKDGQKRYFTDIVVREMEMLGKKSGGDNRPAPQEPQEAWKDKKENNTQSNNTQESNNSTTEKTSTSENIPEGEDDLPF